MNYITTTQLRTKSPQLIDALKKGKAVSLVHRSKVIGEIKPVKDNPKVFNANEFKKLIKKNKPDKLTYDERDRIYRKHLEEKYGKNLS